MAEKTRLLKYGAVTSMAFLCLGALVVAASLHRTRLVQKDAEAFLAELKALSVQALTFRDSEQLAQKYHGIVPDRVPSCSEQQCDYDFVFQNHPLSFLRLAPYTEFSSTIHIENGLASRLSLGMVSHVYDFAEGYPLLGSYLEERPSDDSIFRLGPSGIHVIQDVDIHQRLWRTRTNLGPQANRVVRDQAYDFNLGCLSRIRGCRTFSDLMKSPWPPPQLTR